MCFKSCNIEYKKLLNTLEDFGCREMYEEFIVAEESCERIRMFLNSADKFPKEEFIHPTEKNDRLSLIEIILYEPLETAQKVIDNK